MKQIRGANLPDSRLRIRSSDEVTDALASGTAIVGLESNVVSHGLPKPLNYDTARKVEAGIRAERAVPATIAVLDGEIVVGLTEPEIDRLASDTTIEKVSARDLGHCVARRASGATSIAATLAIAELAGIEVVASAGLGGVHRGATETLDVSADLLQLTRSQTVLVCAGAKPILDLPKTIEFLETHGVPVLGYRCLDFPAFYFPSSGVKCSIRIDDPSKIAAAARAQWATGWLGSVVVAHPIPEEHAIDATTISTAIDAAVGSAADAQITGAAVTKHIMTAINEATKGRTAAANAAVLASTATAAAPIANALISRPIGQAEVAR